MRKINTIYFKPSNLYYFFSNNLKMIGIQVIKIANIKGIARIKNRNKELLPTSSCGAITSKGFELIILS